MKRNFPDLVGWSFEVEEVSAGAYRVQVTDDKGRQVSKFGLNPEKLIEECRAELAIIIQLKTDPKG